MHSCAVLAAAVLLGSSLAAQVDPTTAPTLQVNARVVLVDVVVLDKGGNPVHGLTQTDFAVSENGKLQPIRSFAEHKAEAGPNLHLAAETPGIFTNEHVSASSGAVDILLLDDLNTPADAQPYLRDQLVKFLAAESPGSHVAIFAMTSTLHLLQDFTSDAALLQRAVKAQGVKFSPLLRRSLNDTDSHQEVEALENLLEGANDPGQRKILAGIQQTLLDLEAQRSSAQTQFVHAKRCGCFGRSHATWPAFQAGKTCFGFPVPFRSSCNGRRRPPVTRLLGTQT